MAQQPSVFISYSSKDKDVAKRLAHDLQIHGINVWFDQNEILAGDSIVDRIRDGLRQSDYLLVLISRNSIESRWVYMELDQAFARHPDISNLRVIPLRLDYAEMPPHLRSIRYVDISANYEAGLAELLQRFERDHAGKAKVDEILDVEKFATDLGAEKTVSKGAEFLVATTISMLTLVATVISAVPPFQGALGNRPRVYYTLARHELTFHLGLTTKKFESFLKKKGWPTRLFSFC